MPPSRLRPPSRPGRMRSQRSALAVNPGQPYRRLRSRCHHPRCPSGLAEVAVAIAPGSKAGESRFQIRLDPAELGRIDVELKVDAAGQATTTLTVERMDTLDLLQRDSRALERALGAAGFKTDKPRCSSISATPARAPPASSPARAMPRDHGASTRRFLFAAARDGTGCAPRARQPSGTYPSRLPRLGGLDIRV